MAAQLFYRGTERKVKNIINYEFAQLCIFKLWTGSHNFTTCSSFFAGSPKKQMAGSREPGGKQDQDTGDIFFHSTSLTKFRFCGFRVGHLSSILLFASSTCLLPPIEGIIRIKDFCTPATQLNHSTFDWVFKRFIGSDAYWVQRERCAEIWGFWSQIQVMYKEKSFSTMAASRALHLLKMAFMLLLHVVKSQIL